MNAVIRKLCGKHKESFEQEKNGNKILNVNNITMKAKCTICTTTSYNSIKKSRHCADDTLFIVGQRSSFDMTNVHIKCLNILKIVSRSHKPDIYFMNAEFST